MKKIFSFIFILGFLGLLTPGLTYAQGPVTPAVNLQTTANGTQTAPVGNQVTSNANAQGLKDKPVDESCGFIFSGTLAGCVKAAIATVTYIILGMMSLLLWISGMMLDFVLKYTIIDMSAHINGAGTAADPGLTGINVAWKVIRDLMNIAFIFLLVYEGIKMILGIGNRARDLIVGIIFASLLINFSLFFTKVIIDASNIVTIGFYNSIIDSNAQINPTAPKDSTATTAAGAGKISGLSVPFMKALGVTSFYGTEAFSSTFVSDVGGKTNMIIYAIAGSILFIIVSFSFLAVSVMFVIRYITLIVLLMLSPLGFIGLALPFAKSYSDQWWGALRSQALFAPVYMLMTWVVLTLLASPGFISIAGQGDWGKLVTGVNGEASASSIGLIFNFVIVIGLVILTLKIAKDTSTKGSALIGDATKWATAKVGSAVMGSAALVGRNTIGRAGNAVANDEGLKNTAVNGNLVTRNLARLSLKSGEKAASSNFDARNTSSIGSLAKNTGIDVGKADKKASFRATLEGKAKSAEDMAKRLKPNDDIKAEAEATLKSEEFKEKERLAKEEYNKKYNSTPEGKLRQNALDKKAEIERIKAEVERLTKTRDESRNLAQQAELTKQIDALLLDKTTGQQLTIDNLAAQVKEEQEKVTIADNARKNWISDEQRRLIAAQGGQEENKKTGQVQVESLHAERVKKYADKIENESYMVGYLKNFFRTTALTQTDNAVIARKVRGVTKSKKPVKDQLEALLKEAGEITEKEETPETPTATPPPTTT